VKEHSRIVQDNEDERRKGRIKEKSEFNDIVRGRKNKWNKLVKLQNMYTNVKTKMKIKVKKHAVHKTEGLIRRKYNTIFLTAKMSIFSYKNLVLVTSVVCI
jgi:hypothetical protein